MVTATFDRRRSGIALIEVLLALVLLGAGVGAAMSASAAATRVLRFAEQEQAALFAVEALLDSLAYLPAGAAGTADRAGRELRWSTIERNDLWILELVETDPRIGAGRRYAIVLWPDTIAP